MIGNRFSAPADDPPLTISSPPRGTRATNATCRSDAREGNYKCVIVAPTGREATAFCPPLKLIRAGN